MQTKIVQKWGFVRVGKWTRSNSKITFQLSKSNDKRSIYAFIANDKLKYIGCCEAKSSRLRARLQKYVNQQGRSTSKRIMSEIEKLINEDIGVEIFAWIPPVKLSYKRINVDLIVGFECSLIASWNPPWNIKGRS